MGIVDQSGLAWGKLCAGWSRRFWRIPVPTTQSHQNRESQISSTGNSCDCLHQDRRAGRYTIFLFICLFVFWYSMWVEKRRLICPGIAWGHGAFWCCQASPSRWQDCVLHITIQVRLSTFSDPFSEIGPSIILYPSTLFRVLTSTLAQYVNFSSYCIDLISSLSLSLLECMGTWKYNWLKPEKLPVVKIMFKGGLRDGREREVKPKFMSTCSSSSDFWVCPLK